ncbi:glycosyltransferase 87 family protein [Arthrobacter sp. UYEF3]|uniref:glycosyltransferase 87 family protein n=1 Tax=Arthrobacter sp. UYEF3 TaxID=1756365 RepID=UPI003391C44E
MAVCVAVRAVRYWNAKPDWRSTFAATGNPLAAVLLVLPVLNLGPWRETLAFGLINILLMGLMGADLLARTAFLVGVAAGAGYVDNLSIKGALLHFGVPEAAATDPWIVLSLVVAALAAVIIKAANDQGYRVVASAQPGGSRVPELRPCAHDSVELRLNP